MLRCREKKLCVNEKPKKEELRNGAMCGVLRTTSSASQCDITDFLMCSAVNESFYTISLTVSVWRELAINMVNKERARECVISIHKVLLVFASLFLLQCGFFYLQQLIRKKSTGLD